MQEKPICCSHVYTGERDILLVIRTENHFEFLCGKDHSEDEDFEYIDAEVVINKDDALVNVKELKVNHRLERKSKKDDWVLTYMPCVDLGYIRNLNSSYINDMYGLKLDHLPVLTVDTCSTKSTLQVKTRAFLLAVLIQVSFGYIAAEEAEEYFRIHSLYQFLTEKEKNLLRIGDKEQLVDFTWRSEGLYALLWCLGVEVEIADATTLANLDDVPAELYPFINLQTNPSRFLDNNDLMLRANFSILSVLDYFSRLDYICDLYTINNKEIPVETALVYERRYALLWLYNDVDWDIIKCNSMV